MSVDRKITKVDFWLHACSSSGSDSGSRSRRRSSGSSILGCVSDDELGVADRNRRFTCSRGGIGAVEAFDKTAFAKGVAQVAASLGLYAGRAALLARRRNVAQHGCRFGWGCVHTHAHVLGESADGDCFSSGNDASCDGRAKAK